MWFVTGTCFLDAPKLITALLTLHNKLWSYQFMDILNFMEITNDSGYDSIRLIFERSGASGEDVLTREKAESMLRDSGREGDLEIALQNVGKIDLEHNKSFSKRYLNLVRVAYGTELILSMIITHDSKLEPWEQLDIARNYLYREQNEVVARSGNIPFDLGRDL